jgi:dTDP-4-dehydrorhamnose reductase
MLIRGRELESELKFAGRMYAQGKALMETAAAAAAAGCGLLRTSRFSEAIHMNEASSIKKRAKERKKNRQTKRSASRKEM